MYNVYFSTDVKLIRPHEQLLIESLTRLQISTMTTRSVAAQQQMLPCAAACSCRITHHSRHIVLSVLHCPAQKRNFGHWWPRILDRWGVTAGQNWGLQPTEPKWSNVKIFDGWCDPWHWISFVSDSCWCLPHIEEASLLLLHCYCSL